MLITKKGKNFAVIDCTIADWNSLKVTKKPVVLFENCCFETCREYMRDNDPLYKHEALKSSDVIDPTPCNPFHRQKRTNYYNPDKDYYGISSEWVERTK